MDKCRDKKQTCLSSVGNVEVLNAGFLGCFLTNEYIKMLCAPR